MPTDIPKQYDPAAIEGDSYRLWDDAQDFAAVVDGREDRYVVMMPLPNVTGALHMGHAMDNVMQDLLIRWHRMRGDNTLWQPGTDHAGIGTQAVVEKRLKELEGKTRHDLGREALIQRIWEWKDQYQSRIVEQQKAMGCSCDWKRQRFTMDAVCTAAVREAFFLLFRDGLIYRGNRLVNWDCELRTAVSDDEVVRETRAGHFWHLRYPVVDPRPGEPEYVVVATTRPETMLGDTAVATHPDPAQELERVVAQLRERLEKAPERERPALAEELERVEARRATHLPLLRKLVAMAEDGRKVLLPLQEREIPLILDEWAKPELGSGCVKITPAHDPNDHEVWSRHQDVVDVVNILEPDGTLGENAGPYRGQDRFEARDNVVADLRARGLLDAVEERQVELGVSDRSKTVIEPYLSRQWFVRMGDVEGGVTFGRGTPGEFTGPGLAQAAIDAVEGEWRSPSGRKLAFHPDPERYGSTYVQWLREKRDWCIGRQLWWGHRIPIWSRSVGAAELAATLDAVPPAGDDVAIWVGDDGGGRHAPADALRVAAERPERAPFEVQVCPRGPAAQERWAAALDAAGLAQSEDVLDTWFSSALWPFSTLGWPDPERAAVDPGQRALGARDGQPSSLAYYYPGSCLVTGRDIITLWVARMTILGLYCLGDLPFTDAFIHASILDGRGERMSKSKGNGIDPVDIIERYGADAMRYVLCDMQTGTQDIRLPVQVTSPFTGRQLQLSDIEHGQNEDGSVRIFTYLDPDAEREFDVLGTMQGMPVAKPYSDRFEVGRNFCNKLWNAARFALLNLEGQGFEPLSRERLADEDRWILSRLARATTEVQGCLEDYAPSAALTAARDFFWNELCDWYLELVKPRMRDDAERPVAGQVLAVVLDQSLRLFHPFVPFITEALWGKLRELAPVRGIDAPLPASAHVATAAWPAARGADRDPALEGDFDLLQGTIRAIRDLRARYGEPSKPLEATIKARGPALVVLERLRDHVERQARLSALVLAEDPPRPPLCATGVVGDVEVYVSGLVDPEKERQRLETQKERLAGRIRGLEGRLANGAFVAKAPAEVVENDRRQLAALRVELAGLEESLAAL